jgi:hypothetical protein
MGRVLFAGSAVVLFVLAFVILLASSGGGERLAAALSVGGLACLSASVLAQVNDPRR